MAEADNSGKTWEQSELGQYLLGAGVEELITGKNDDGDFVMTPLKDFFEDADTVGMYFSAHWCPPCRGFTPKLAETYESKLKAEGMRIIFNSWDRDEEAFNDYYKKEMPWAAIPYKYKEALEKSKAVKRPGGIPSLYLFNNEGGLYQTSGRAAVHDGRPYPYGNPSWDDMLDLVIDKEGNKVDKQKTIKSKKYVALYFSAHWCPPCRGFTPKLAETYNKMKESREDFEFIFVSSDRDESSFNEYFAEMPWLAFDKKASNYDMVKSTLSDMFDVSGIPYLAVVDASDCSIINKSARGDAGGDPEGKNFPWPPKPMYTFTEGKLDGINDNKSIVLMMDKGSLENKDEVYQHMSEHAKEQLALKNNREFFHFASLQDNPIAPQIRKFAALDDGDHMICLDFSEKSFYQTALPTSPADVQAFAKSIVDGTAEKKALAL